ncbi:lipid-A-disaccharide synthase [Methylotenera sp.]|uniref:lipid-A-disaccharide synthase n=1 Tax=Methylotenera sp. TaxID=2051956 RepID=UPI00272F9124|nr:lipid-A-disaccharide synthase [Methylotenera sp.]MDP2071528.1 lipid-A-disaccharide synthase [Methylotenera sp.]MDP2231722.1 lipid-A-disaccharide synthase [Methylotenera sp.]MDP3004949.1 lipid-A-disaccharide synthase [Methylotenera sp.]MDP3140806.1 lipid-A-disaccharide synthase [Methylotenera sp.]
MVRIGIVAGEASGDLLGSHLIQALKSKRSDIEFVGIAGPKMMGEGAQSLFPIERLSVRGYIEVIKHLFGLLKLRRQLLKHFLTNRIDLFIGVDAPDFNFWLEKKLKNKGIKTIHYVSPSVWAWRKNRIKKIKHAVSHMLALFPFEPALYQGAGIPVTYVGHPLADILPMEPDTNAARDGLRLKSSALVIAMLPGSRQSEVQQHAELFVKTAKLIYADYPNAIFLVPLITRETRQIFELAIFHEHENLPIQILFGHAHDAMEAADVVIVASGTATLEAALLKKPMVITYRMSKLSWQILKRMRLQPYVGLPNILADKFVVPELLQDDSTPEKLAEATIKLISDTGYAAEIKAEFTKIHLSLRQNTAEKAAVVILSHLA